MKPLPLIRQGARVVSGAMALAVGGFTMAGLAPVVNAAETGFMNKVLDWQNKMSDKFRDTWQGIRKEGKPSVVSASVDLREQEKSYMLRLDLPGRDLEKVEISLKDDTLHILAPEVGQMGRYEQEVTLSGVVPGTQPVIRRKKDEEVIVVTIPKGTKDLGPVLPPAVPDIPWAAASPLEKNILRQMNDLQQEMNGIFDDAFRDIPRTPEWKSYFDSPRFGSFIDLKEEGPNYVVTAYLPERDVKNVDAVIEGKVLKIEALAEDAETKTEVEGKTATARKAYYSQQLTLPVEVQANEINIERKEGILKVIVSKVD